MACLMADALKLENPWKQSPNLVDSEQPPRERPSPFNPPPTPCGPCYCWSTYTERCVSCSCLSKVENTWKLGELVSATKTVSQEPFVQTRLKDLGIVETFKQ